ncbi:hypothetical protein ABS71_15645 [bacterium SCN 62-11]|nr:MAG: hypothetical protein ABS71_15645 [bacterium SCN 62-11]
MPGWYALLLPTTFLSLGQALTLYTSLSIVVFVSGIAWLTCELFGARLLPLTLALLLTLGTLLSPLGLDNLVLAQVGLLCAGLLAGAYAAWLRGLPFLAGSLLGLASLSKAYPVLLLASLARKQKQRALWGWLAVVGVTHAIALAYAGLPLFFDFFSSVLHLPIKAYDRSHSVPAVLIRFWPGWEPELALFSKVLFAGMLLLYFRGAWRARRRGAEALWLAVGILTFQTMAAFCWTYQCVLNIVPLLLVVSQLKPGRPWAALAAVALTIHLALSGDLVWNGSLNAAHASFRAGGWGAWTATLALIALLIENHRCKDAEDEV